MQENNILLSRIRWFSLWVAAILILGTVGYSLIEGWNAHDGFYMSVITMATVGYGETRELSGLGRLFTCGLIFLSIISLSCWTACLTGFFVDQELTRTLQQRKSKKKAKRMNDHTIICGTGQMAKTLLDALLRAQEPVVVVDSNTSELKRIRQRYPGVPTIEASAVDELALAEANVLDAKCVVATLDSDFDNLMIAMTCRDLGSSIKVIARSDDLQVASRMSKIGVDEVICPFHLSGEHAAKLACQ